MCWLAGRPASQHFSNLVEENLNRDHGNENEKSCFILSHILKVQKNEKQLEGNIDAVLCHL